MPVIRDPQTQKALDAVKRKLMVSQLRRELAGDGQPDGPVIFEVPLNRSSKIDVLVVWQEFNGVPVETRTEIILEAYDEKQTLISQAMGVTHAEALEDNLLPFSIRPSIQFGGTDPTLVRNAMLEEGGIRNWPDIVELRFPTMLMAKAAHQRLCAKIPEGQWSIEQSGGTYF